MNQLLDELLKFSQNDYEYELIEISEYSSSTTVVNYNYSVDYN